jgi:hypothetical protein
VKPRVLLLDNGLSTACWEALGVNGKRGWSSSYPTLNIDGWHVSARRYCYEQAHGPIPAEHQVFSRCGLHRCINPEHLFLRRLGDPMYRDRHPVMEAA